MDSLEIQPLVVVMCLLSPMYSKHQLQLKQDTSVPRQLNTYVFVIYTQLHALPITFMYRATCVFTTSTHEVLFYMHTHVLAVLCVITTCTSIDSPQLDQVTCTATSQCFDH